MLGPTLLTTDLTTSYFLGQWSLMMYFLCLHAQKNEKISFTNNKRESNENAMQMRPILLLQRDKAQSSTPIENVQPVLHVPIVLFVRVGLTRLRFSRNIVRALVVFALFLAFLTFGFLAFLLASFDVHVDMPGSLSFLGIIVFVIVDRVPPAT